MKLSSITTLRVSNAIRTMILITPALIARHFKHSVWIITERPDQARDNGYCFYKYLKEYHPEQPAYYVIDMKSKDYKKVAPFGSIIQFDSWKHYFLYCLSPVHISAHVGGCNPHDNPIVRRAKKIIGYHDVFLPHGVSYGVSEFCLEKYAKIDLFICSGKPEYDNVLANYGYTKDQVAYTGFPRLDGWHNIKTNPKQILLMPTWRLYLAQDSSTVFEDTEYYKAYQSLIDNHELHDFLVSNELKLIFYLHHNMQIYAESYHTSCPNIEVVYNDETYDIQELLKESALLITDYSSVHFDFAYMGKPVMYYQFDKEEFWKKQYEQSGFDASKDGFGPVSYNLKQLLYEVKQAYNEDFKLKGEYEHRMEQFYQLRDDKNCERVYREIIKHFGRGGAHANNAN